MSSPRLTDEQLAKEFGRRSEGTAFDLPQELGYVCPQGHAGDILTWSEFNDHIWCYACEKKILECQQAIVGKQVYARVTEEKNQIQEVCTMDKELIEQIAKILRDGLGDQINTEYLAKEILSLIQPEKTGNEKLARAYANDMDTHGYGTENNELKMEKCKVCGGKGRRPNLILGKPVTMICAHCGGAGIEPSRMERKSTFDLSRDILELIEQNEGCGRDAEGMPASEYQFDKKQALADITHYVEELLSADQQVFDEANKQLQSQISQLKELFLLRR